MPDKLTTLKLKDDPTTSVYPNIQTANIPDGGVSTAKLAVGAVTSAKIANNTITALQIADDAITTNKIYSASVTSAKLASSSVSTAKIASGAVTSSKIASGAVDTSQIADGAVTEAKLSLSSINTLYFTNYSFTIPDVATLSFVAFKTWITSCIDHGNTFVFVDGETRAQAQVGISTTSVIIYPVTAIPGLTTITISDNTDLQHFIDDWGENGDSGEFMAKGITYLAS